MALIITVILVLLSLVIWKVKRIYSFWDGKGIPHVGFWEFFQMTYRKWTKPLHDCLLEDYATHGRLYGTYQEIDPCLVVGEPDVIRQIFVTDFASFADRFSAQQYGNKIWDNTVFSLTSPKWKNVRNNMTPGQTTSRLKEMLPKLLQVGNRMADYFEELSAQDSPVEVHEVFTKFALDSVAAIVFSADVDSNRDPQNPFLKYYYNVFGGDEGLKTFLMFTNPRLFKLLHLDILSKEPANVFLSFVEAIVKERLKSNEKINDQLQLLLESLDDGETKTGPTDTTSDSGKRLTVSDVMSQALVFFLGGSDTIAWALTFTAYTLAMHPDCQDKVLEEIDRVMGEEEVTYAKLQELLYTDAVVKESTRLYTTDPLLLRMCTEETTVRGIRFTPGMMIHVPAQALHLDPEFYPEPHSFLPERFMPENKDALNPYTFMPFGAGPRGCVGMRQAMMQLKLALVCFYRKMRFERCTETVEQLELRPRRFLRDLVRPIKLNVVRHRST